MNAATIALVCLVSTTVLSARPQPAPQQRSAGPELKNVKVLKDLSPLELIHDMQFISASLGVNCSFCHVFKPGNERDFASDDKEEKRTARSMMQLVMDTNAKFFEGHTVVSCNTCHRGSSRPVNVPLLPVAEPAARRERREEASATAGESKPAVPTRDELVSHYAKAAGEIDRTAISSIELKGSLEMGGHPAAPIDVVLANGSTRVTTTTPEGEMINVVTPAGGWARDERGTHAMFPMQLAGAREVLDALRLPLPADIPAEGRIRKGHIEYKDVWILTTPPGTHIRQQFYFDAETGLLLRHETLTTTPIGVLPQRTDFNDYRDVGGFKLPFSVAYESVDHNASRSVHYTEIVPNAKIDQKVFAQPE